ncbi:MAG: heme ABC transporter ATP-binding protein [Lawsonella sp.]|nr:heme ABC transporter ATP-binding protein [Mycobacteriales bacterium]
MTTLEPLTITEKLNVAPGDVLMSCTGVHCERGKKTVLEDVSLDIRAGEIIALVGPNGAGKSTLLSVLAGDLPTTQGQVKVFGKDLPKLSTRDLAHRRAVLTQSNHVGFEFFVEEVIEMGRAPWVRTDYAAEDEESIAEAIQLMGVEKFLKKLFNQLSGGEKARVSMTRVLAQRTPILMLDEPTAALDIQYQERLMQVVRQRVRQHVGAVVVLHDLGLAAAYADRVVVLADGKLVAQGNPREVLTADLLSSVYNTPVHIVEDGFGSFQVVPVRSAH